MARIAARGTQRSRWRRLMPKSSIIAASNYGRWASSEARLQMRLYRADFHAIFHDVRPETAANTAYHDPVSYVASQRLAAQLLEEGSNGVIYRSVRRPGGQCLACFRPALVMNVRSGGHYEYRWEGTRTPRIRSLGRG